METKTPGSFVSSCLCGESPQGDTIKALTIHQPWASAIARGAKKIETRSWPTKYRGPLLIHAGKHQLTAGERETLCPKLWGGVKNPGGPWDNYNVFKWIDGLPYGAIIAVCRLVGCFEIRKYNEPDSGSRCAMTKQEFALGDYTPGRYAWVLANVRKLPEPIPYKGRQGLWDVPIADLPKGVL